MGAEAPPEFVYGLKGGSGEPLVLPLDAVAGLEEFAYGLKGAGAVPALLFPDEAPELAYGLKGVLPPVLLLL